MTKIDIADMDCIYLSYNEPKKEEFWVQISNMVPWAKRVDGVTGIDTAHKAAAELSETDRFIIIDGDNIPDSNFFNQRLVLNDYNKDCVFRWKAKNIINGLVYGNGGLSCWTKDFVRNMKSHENSSKNDQQNNVEFCFDPKYIAMHDCYSTTYPNQSELQAFRSGYREGVKLSCNRGVPFNREVHGLMNKYIHPKNLRNLMMWCTVGADVEYGEHAIAGAIYGIIDIVTAPEHAIELINNYDEFSERVNVLINKTDWTGEIRFLANRIKEFSILSQDIIPMSAEMSKFFKFCLGNYENKGINEIE